MALITCPDCQTEVSDAASACPKCGRPMAAPAVVQTQGTQGVTGAFLDPMSNVRSCFGCTAVPIIALVVVFLLGLGFMLVRACTAP